MALHVTNTANVIDNGTLNLDDAAGVATAVVGGTTYLFVPGPLDNGVSVFAVGPTGTLTNVGNVSDDGTLELAQAAGVATAVVGGTTYLFVAGLVDDGVSVFSVAADGTLTNVDNVGDDATRELNGAIGVTTAAIAGTTYLFVTGLFDDGISVFSVAADGTLTSVDDVSDDATVELDAPHVAATAVVGGATYLFVPAAIDDGISVFAVANDGTLANVGNVGDDATLELDGAVGATTAVVGGVTYLFVSGGEDDGVSVFSVAADGSLTNVDNVADDATLGLDGAGFMSTAVIGGVTYLFVGAFSDDAVTVFRIGADGTLTHDSTIADGGARELDAVTCVTIASIGGTPHLFAAGQFDDGVSVFALAGSVASLGDVLWQHNDGTVATAARELPSISSVWQIEGAGDFDADGDADILWRHDGGQVVTWEMQNGQLLATHSLAVGSGGWGIEHLGDFDGDGDADILWRHTGGAVVTWEMEDGAFVRTHSIASAPPAWRIDGTGDFDGDGDADILWRHTTAGAVVTWEMEDGEFVQSHSIASASTAWQIRGTGDFDGDGDADILWHHTNGAVVFWEMQGGALVTNRNLPAVGTSWQIRGTEDFDSDGDADILWRNDDGTVVTWQMQDGALARTENFGQVSNSWQIRGTGEFDLV
jgi:6-phosphogluconolactonase (cycloisomerase 2 family)